MDLPKANHLGMNIRKSQNECKNKMDRTKQESKDAVAARIRLIRRALGYPQAKVCKIIGVAIPTWSNWEAPHVRRMPTAKQFAALEYAFGFPREWIQSGIATRMPRKLSQKLQDALDELEAPQTAPETLN